ncbi:hypothetical protein BD560DRAFT_96823 [Blakeslea trispora]|nr:hypothetical protein BD560DRAFT_96823 [Blakeslea trispora]
MLASCHCLLSSIPQAHLFCRKKKLRDSPVSTIHAYCLHDHFLRLIFHSFFFCELSVNLNRAITAGRCHLEPTQCPSRPLLSACTTLSTFQLSNTSLNFRPSLHLPISDPSFPFRQLDSCFKSAVLRETNHPPFFFVLLSLSPSAWLSFWVSLPNANATYRFIIHRIPDSPYYRSSLCLLS